MSKLITSPVKQFPGTVILADPILFPQYFAYTAAIRAAQALDKDKTTLTEWLYAILPGLIACIENWNIPTIPDLKPELFPATPQKPIQHLISWLLGEVGEIVNPVETAPNE